MRVRMRQMAVILPFTLVGALGVGLVAQSVGFESNDLLAGPQSGDPTELNALHNDPPPPAAAPQGGSRLGELLLPDGHPAPAKPAAPGIHGFTKPSDDHPAATPSGSEPEKSDPDKADKPDKPVSGLQRSK